MSSDEEENRVRIPLNPHPAGGLRPDDVPALFWDEMPEDAENPDLAAINALIEESSPEERALSFKEQGNRALKTGIAQCKRFYLRQAIEQYTEGLSLRSSDHGLVSVLYANRAQVNILLGNFRNALLDAQDSVRYDGTNVKAYFRGAKAALCLNQWDQCRDLCNAGLEREADNVELRALLTSADERQAAEAAAEAAEAARQHHLRAPSRKIADALIAKGRRIGRPQFGVGDRKPRIEQDEIRWPVLFFYPEASMANDAVEDFGEEDTFADHLDVMFGPESPPLDWDPDGRYSRQQIEVYYLSHAAKPLDRDELVEALHGGWPRVVDEGPARYGPRAAKWEVVSQGQTLGEVLGRADHIIPGIPVFFVLAMDTPFRKDFLEGDVALLR